MQSGNGGITPLFAQGPAAQECPGLEGAAVGSSSTSGHAPTPLQARSLGPGRGSSPGFLCSPGGSHCCAQGSLLGRLVVTRDKCPHPDLPGPGSVLTSASAPGTPLPCTPRRAFSPHFSFRGTPKHLSFFSSWASGPPEASLPAQSTLSLSVGEAFCHPLNGP